MSAARSLVSDSRPAWPGATCRIRANTGCPVPGLADTARELGLASGESDGHAAVEQAGSNFYRGFLQACFDLHGDLISEGDAGPAIRYTDRRDGDVRRFSACCCVWASSRSRSGQRYSAVTGTCFGSAAAISRSSPG